jgi:type I restriction enzyme S subunit
MLAALWPLPPLGEQDAIIKKLEAVTKGHKSLCKNLLAEIDFLHEYRTRLIADIVTGKLDVRDVATKVPEETGEPEELEDQESVDDRAHNEADEVDCESIAEEAQA